MLKMLNLGLAFVLELGLLVALAVWGFRAGENTVVQLVLGLGVPLLAAVIWGVFLSPKAPRRLGGLPYLGLKAILFGLATLALAAAGEGTLAIIFAVLVIANQALLYAWGQEPIQP